MNSSNQSRAEQPTGNQGNLGEETVGQSSKQLISQWAQRGNQEAALIKQEYYNVEVGQLLLKQRQNIV